MLNVQLFVRIRAWDRDGNITHDVKEESRSLVKVFLATLLAQMGSTTGDAKSLSGTHDDTGGSARTIKGAVSANVVGFGAKGAVNIDTHGIVIGTTATAVDITDTKLVVQIMDGTSSGEMLHALQTYDGDITIADPDATFVTSRNFNNNSSGTITVKETGIYATAEVGGTARFFCIVRDVPTELAVADGGGCQVEYTFKISE